MTKNTKKHIKLASETIPTFHLDKLSKWILTYPRLTKGTQTIEFERQFASYLGTKQTTFVNSGSSANLLMAAANLHFGNLKNKKVAIPSVSWVTTVSPFIQLGYEPFLLDCDPHNLGINIDHLYKVIKDEDISTLIIVHVLGHDSSINKVIDICDEFNIRLFEDGCQALGSTLSNKMLGSYGLASSCSFYYGHHISTIEGGSVSTSNFEFGEIVKSIRSHGWNRDLSDNTKNSLKDKFNISEFRDLYTFYYPGLNIRSTDLNAYLGTLQMEIIKEYCNQRFKIFNHYRNKLQGYWTQSSCTEFISSFAYSTLVKNPEEVWVHLKNNYIESRPLISGSMGLQPFWKEFYGQTSSFNYADQVHKYGIYLPINADLEISDIDRVCETFKEIAQPYKW